MNYIYRTGLGVFITVPYGLRVRIVEYILLHIDPDISAADVNISAFAAADACAVNEETIILFAFSCYSLLLSGRLSELLFNGRTAFTALPFGSWLRIGNKRGFVVFINDTVACQDNVLSIELDDLLFKSGIFFFLHIHYSPLTKVGIRRLPVQIQRLADVNELLVGVRIIQNFKAVVHRAVGHCVVSAH